MKLRFLVVLLALATAGCGYTMPQLFTYRSAPPEAPDSAPAVTSRPPPPAASISTAPASSPVDSAQAEPISEAVQGRDPRCDALARQRAQDAAMQNNADYDTRIEDGAYATCVSLFARDRQVHVAGAP